MFACWVYIFCSVYVYVCGLCVSRSQQHIWSVCKTSLYLSLCLSVHVCVRSRTLNACLREKVKNSRKFTDWSLFGEYIIVSDSEATCIVFDFCLKVKLYGLLSHVYVLLFVWELSVLKSLAGPVLYLFATSLSSNQVVCSCTDGPSMLSVPLSSPDIPSILRPAERSAESSRELWEQEQEASTDPVVPWLGQAALDGEERFRRRLSL